MDESIHHINQGNVCHYYVDIDGQYDELENGTTKAVTNVQASINLDETQHNSHTIVLVFQMAFSSRTVTSTTTQAPKTTISQFLTLPKVPFKSTQ